MHKPQLLKNMNKVVQFLTLSDFLFYSAVGLVTPFLTIFISEEISDGTIALAGLSITLHLILRGIIQIPISRIVDEKQGEYDDYLFLFWGIMISTLAYLLFAFSTFMWQIFILQAISAIGTAFSMPTWYAIFTRHINKEKAASQWTFYDTIISIGQALTAGLGGFAIATMDYKTVFLIVATFSFTSGLFILGIKQSLIDS